MTSRLINRTTKNGILLKSFVSIALVLSLSNLQAQTNTDCKCCTKAYQAFDFWVGEWEVYNTKGELVGTNVITKEQNGCLVKENWISENGVNTGTSYNYFNTNDSTWHQVWISNTGFILELAGELNSNNSMILKSELVETNKGKYYNQISWKLNTDRSISQIWNAYGEKRELLMNIFEGTYRKKE